MRISELSSHSGVPIPTIKYYVREGLLPRGEVTSATQARYDDEHLRRLRLIRALAEVGHLPLASIHAVLDAVDQPDVGIHNLLGSAQWAAGFPAHEPLADEMGQTARRQVDDLIAETGWQVHTDAPACDELARALATLDRLGLPADPGTLRSYAHLGHQAAEMDLRGLPEDVARSTLVEHAVVTTLMYERIFTALHRLAQEDLSARRYGRPPPL